MYTHLGSQLQHACLEELDLILQKEGKMKIAHAVEMAVIDAHTDAEHV